MGQLKDLIERNAVELRELKARIDQTWKSRRQSPENQLAWENARANFHQRYNDLAFPGGYAGVLNRILDGDPPTIEAALSFIEVRPYFFRSGYMFEDLLRKLKRAPLRPADAERLGQALQAYDAYRANRRERLP